MRKTLATMLLGFSTALLLGGCAGGTDTGGGVSSSGISSTRVTDDPIEAAYFGVYVWKAAVEKAQSQQRTGMVVRGCRCEPRR